MKKHKKDPQLDTFAHIAHDISVAKLDLERHSRRVEFVTADLSLLEGLIEEKREDWVGVVHKLIDDDCPQSLKEAFDLIRALNDIVLAEKCLRKMHVLEMSEKDYGPVLSWILDWKKQNSQEK